MVRTDKSPWGKLIVLLPTDAVSAPGLAVEETAFRSFQKQTIWVVALRRDVCIKTFIAELRTQQASLADQVAMLNIDLIAALMKIRRRLQSREGVQAEIIEFLWIECNGDGSGLLG